MNKLAELIDNLPLPHVPSSLSAADRQLIQLMVESARQQIRPYTGNFEVAWLLVPFERDVWYTTNRGREELVNGVWTNAITIDWRVQLPNGCLLTDGRYITLLTTIKKVCFLMRSNLIRGFSAPAPWAKAVEKLKAIVRWAVLYEGRFQPDTHGLRLIDQAALDWMLEEYTQGGWPRVLQIPQRLLCVFYHGAHGTDCPSSLLTNPYLLPASEIVPMIRWIDSHGGYKKMAKGQYKGKRMLHRPWLGHVIHEDANAMMGPRVNHFCRQFESDFLGFPLLVSPNQFTEFPSHRVESSADSLGGTTDRSVHQVSSVFASLLDAHRHLPDFLPDPTGLYLRRAVNQAKRFTRPIGHTPFIPINSGLAYLNMAMRFIHLYGDALVGLYLAVVSSTPQQGEDKQTIQNSAFKRYAQNWRIASGESITDVLNITQFNGEGRQVRCDFHRYRTNPNLDDALRVLIGSCIVCMAILKPSREEELTHLKRNCLRVDHNGYWLNYELGKSKLRGVEVWQEADRPIPVIAARGIQLLQRLGNGLCEILGGTTKHAGNLFFLPTLDGQGALKADGKLLNDHLDDFCDFVGLPPDSEGRRWYVRIHEMRKWFLLLLFWSGRFDVLDAARWIAGHTDAAHIYAYIEKEFPGESLPQIEAQYSEERLRQLAQGQSGDEDGANALYEAVLRHFNVESLTMIPDAEWAGYVRALRETDKFHLEPHSIRDEDGSVVGINVSFIMRDLT